MQGRRLVFRRLRNSQPPQEGLAEPRREFRHEHGGKEPRRHPMFGAMKGLITIEPGYDLTQPAMPEWADMLDKKYGPEKRK